MTPRQETEPLSGMRFAGRLRHQLGDSALTASREATAGRAAAGGRRLRLVLMAAAVVAAALAVVLIGLPGVRSGGPSQATAYEQLRPSLIRVRDVHSFLMTSEQEGSEGQIVKSLRTVLATNGDWSFEAREYVDGRLQHAPTFTTYDASSNTLRLWGWGPLAAGLRSWRRGDPPSAVMEFRNPEASQAFVAWQAQRSAAMGFLYAGYAHAQSVTYLGRPAWKVSMRVGSPGSGRSPMDMVIDKSSGIVLEQVSYDQAGVLIGRIGVTGLEINPTMPPGEPSVAFPGKVHFGLTEGGYRRMSLRQAELRSHGKVLVAGWTPPGFALQMVTYNQGASYRLPGAQRLLQAPMAEVVYRAGLDYLLLKTASSSRAPLTPKVFPGQPIPVKLTGGLFAGRTARVDMFNGAEVSGHGLTLWASGTVSQDELVRVLNSIIASSP